MSNIKGSKMLKKKSEDSNEPHLQVKNNLKFQALLLSFLKVLLEKVTILLIKHWIFQIVKEKQGQNLGCSATRFSSALSFTPRSNSSKPVCDTKSLRGLPSSFNLGLPHRNECDVLVVWRQTTHMLIAHHVYIKGVRGEQQLRLAKELKIF